MESLMGFEIELVVQIPNKVVPIPLWIGTKEMSTYTFSNA